MEDRITKATEVGLKVHPFEWKMESYLATVEGGKAVVPSPGPQKGSALPLQIPPILLDATAGESGSAATLPEPDKFPQIPQLCSGSAERRALVAALRHTVPVGVDWDYYLLVERKAEWEAALQTQPPRRLVTKRFIDEELYFLKGCHLLEGRGSLSLVLQRLASDVSSDDALDEKLKDWLVLKVELGKVRNVWEIPVMAEVLRVNKKDGTPNEDWDDSIHPHIFGPLPLDAVVGTAPVLRNLAAEGREGYPVVLGEFVDFREPVK